MGTSYKDLIDHPIEHDISNNDIDFSEEIDDYGQVLRMLRENMGITITSLAKQINIDPTKISQIERSIREVPTHKLGEWLECLGCKKNKKKLLEHALQFRLKHDFALRSNDPSNSDIIRLIKAYKQKKLTTFDRQLLVIIAREEL